MAVLVAVVAAFTLGAGCEKKPEKSEPKPVASSTAGVKSADGVRRIKIEAGRDGYVPERIAGKPGEKLVLEFTRTVEGECLSRLKAPDGKEFDLPMNTAVDVPVTVPATGEVKFACGMEMFFGVIVAEKA